MLKKMTSPNSNKIIKIILFSSACIIISMFDLHIVLLKCFCSFMCPLNVFQTYIKNFNRKLFPGICWKNGKSPNSKKFLKIIFFSSACIIISMFDLHTVHLKCFCSFMWPLNLFQTNIKNFNRKRFPWIYWNKNAGMRTLRLAHLFMTNMNSQLSMFFQWTYHHVEEG